MVRELDLEGDGQGKRGIGMVGDDTPGGGGGGRCDDAVIPLAPSSHGSSSRPSVITVVPSSASECGEGVSPFIFTSPSNPLNAYSKHVCDEEEEAEDEEGNDAKDDDDQDKDITINDNNDNEIITTATAAAVAGVLHVPEHPHKNQAKALRRAKAPLSEAMVEVMLDYSALFDQMQEVLEEGNNEEKGEQPTKGKARRIKSTGKPPPPYTNTPKQA